MAGIPEFVEIRKWALDLWPKSREFVPLAKRELVFFDVVCGVLDKCLQSVKNEILDNSTIELVEKIHTLRVENNSLMEIIKVLSNDMHKATTCPCDTCRLATNILGEPFGCEALRKKMKS